MQLDESIYLRDEAEVERLKRNPLYQEALNYVHAHKKEIQDSINKHITFEQR
jgi:hypothetical protein